MKLTSLILVAFISIQSLALADSNIVMKLKNPSQASVIQNYEALCDEDGISAVGASLNQMCEVVTKSHLCAKISKDDLLNCQTLNRNIVQSYVANKWDFLLGCAQGAFTSVKDTLSFFWDVMKWAWNNSTSSEARGRSAAAVSEVSNAAKLYLHTEYQKAYAKASPPLQEVKAITAMNAAIGKLIYDKVVEFLQEQNEEFGCLNEEAKSKRVCKVAGDIFLPPTGALALIKYGSKGLKQLPKFVNYFKKVPVITFAKLTEKYPLLTRTLDSMGEDIPTAKMISHPRDIPFTLSNRFRPVKDDEMLKRANDLEPEMAKTITAVYNNLNDPDQLRAYYRGLFREAAEWMGKKGRPEDLILLEAGKVSKHAIAVAVVRRLKARGDTGFTTIVKKKEGGTRLSYGSQNVSLKNPEDANEFFRAAVKTGPFIDRNFNDMSRTNHGIFTHMIQRDIVHNTLVKETNGNPKKFYDYLGTKKGINWWADLFDSGDRASMTRPEKVTEYISHQMTLNSSP